MHTPRGVAARTPTPTDRATPTTRVKSLRRENAAVVEELVSTKLAAATLDYEKQVGCVWGASCCAYACGGVHCPGAGLFVCAGHCWHSWVCVHVW